MINFTIKISVYKTDINVIIGGSVSERKKLLKSKGFSKCYAERLLDRIVDHDATAVEHESGDQTLFFNELPSKDNFWLSILVHETLHSACFILRRKSIPLTDESEEAYTYLQQMIFEEILNNIGDGRSF